MYIYRIKTQNLIKMSQRNKQFTIDWKVATVYNKDFFTKLLLFVAVMIVFVISNNYLNQDLENDFLNGFLKGLYYFGYLIFGYLLLKVLDQIIAADEVESADYGPYCYKRNFNFLAKTNWKLLINLGIGVGILFLVVHWMLPFLNIESDHPLAKLFHPNTFIAILLAWGVVRIFQYFANDYSQVIFKDISYFYPSILSIVILLFVIAQQEQFASFFIELMDSPGNLAFFALLFFISILIVWFAPSYLRFTDKAVYVFDYDKNNQEDKKNLPRPLKIIAGFFQLIPYSFTYLIWRIFFRKRNWENDFLYSLIWEHSAYVNNKITYREPRGFVLARILFGLAYIGTLAFLAGGVYLKSRALAYEGYNSYFFLAVLVLPAFSLYYHFYRDANGKSKVTKRSMHIDWWANTLFFGALIVALIAASFFTSINPDSGGLFDLLLFFVIANILTSLIFIKIAYINVVDKARRNHLKYFTRFIVSIVLASNLFIALISIIFFVLLFFLPFTTTYPWLTNINTINIYLLGVNGLIAFITIFDRFFMIKTKIQQHANQKDRKKDVMAFEEKGYKTLEGNSLEAFDEVYEEQGKSLVNRPSSLAWGVVLILFMLGMYFSKQRNTYHKVPYNSSTESQQIEDQSITLEDYTQRFLNRLESDSTDRSPIILIGADGGGLKAAYWTMLNLHYLDSLGLYDKNVFLMAGASGGSLGEGLYTYMKAQQLSPPQIKKIILELGDENLISGDLGGLFARWPMSYIPDIPGYTFERQDRMEAMAEYYFDRIQEIIRTSGFGNNGDQWSYETVRKNPYSYLWTQNDYSIPLIITNTARAEDGVKGWAHPLTYNPFFGSGVVDISRRIDLETNPAGDTSYISFPDALFLTNRFPILSPVGVIDGKGHFIDAGAIDNSGVGTLLQVSTKMKAIAKNDSSSIFRQFFEARDILMITIRNDRSRFINSEFTSLLHDRYGNVFRRSEISSFLGAVTSSGISGDPKVMDDIVGNGEAKKLLGIDTLLKLNLPFRLSPEMVQKAYKRDLPDNLLAQDGVVGSKVDELNQQIMACLPEGTMHIVEPPLGRLISRPAQEYAQKMMRHEKIRSLFNTIESWESKK